jgi:hypothetical protein
MRLTTLDPHAISRQLYICGGLCCLGSTRYVINKINVERQVNINHTFNHSSIDHLYKFKSFNDVKHNINVPVPSLSYLNPSFFHLNVLINLIFISICCRFIMLSANLLTCILSFIVNSVKVCFIPSSAVIFSDSYKHLKCIWIEFWAIVYCIWTTKRIE